jgi:hypothetical protein
VEFVLFALDDDGVTCVGSSCDACADVVFLCVDEWWVVNESQGMKLELKMTINCRTDACAMHKINTSTAAGQLKFSSAVLSPD